MAGIKTNLGLFRRILADEDFRSGQIDTGYLERLLGDGSGTQSDESGAETRMIAATAAAVFALLDSRSNGGGNGAATGPEAGASTWKKAARSEGLM